MSKKFNYTMLRVRLTGPITAGLMLAVAGAPALAQNNGGSSLEAAASAQASQDGLPSVEKLAEMVVKAIGGRDNIDRVKTLRTVMSMNVSGMAITMENKWGRDGGRWSKSSFASGETGTDGTTAWMKAADGSYILIGDAQAQELNGQASMHMMMLDPEELKKNMQSMEVVGREEFDGRMCYKLRFQPKNSEDHSFIFFDASDGMPRGMMETQPGLSGEPQTSKIMLGDWKTIEGVKFFHSMKVESPGIPGGSAEMKVTTLEVNKLDKDTFALPAEVKELVANADKPAESDAGENEVATGEEIQLEDLPEAYRERTKMMLEQMKQAGAEGIAAALQQYEQVMPSIPEGNDKLTLQYIIQELKKVK